LRAEPQVDSLNPRLAGLIKRSPIGTATPIFAREGKEGGHIPAWDLTLSAPKSFSLAALVGEDGRLIRAAQLANAKAMEVMEGNVQARGGGNHLPINTGRWIVATFPHDTSRPVEGYPAP
jgi:conjugative relaxase-like TrwC/TraI family protein